MKYLSKFSKVSFLWIVFSLLLIWLMQIFLIRPFFHSGFFPTHDNVQVVRVFEMSQSLRYGDIPPRWSAGLLYGYGYPLYVFYGQFVYILGAIFSFLGLNYLLATKATFILGFLVGATGIFFLLCNWFGNWKALLGTIVYSVIPYRAVDVYVRGSLAEFFGYSLLPWVFLTNFKLLEKSTHKIWIILFSLSIAVLVITHNLTAFITILALGFFDSVYVLKTPRKNSLGLIRQLGVSYGLALMLSAYYWLPALYENQFVKLSQFLNYPYQDFFLTIPQLWYMLWGFNGFTETARMSLQFGQAILVFSLLAVIANLFIKTKYRLIISLLSSIFLFSVFLETSYSQFIWDKVAVLHYLQFPWRFHILGTNLAIILSISFFYLVEQINFIKSKNVKLAVVGLLMLVFLGWSLKEGFNLFKPKNYSEDPPVSETTTWNDEYLPEWVMVKPRNYAADKFRFALGSGQLKDISWGYLQKKVVIESTQSGVIQVSQIYYPGWTAYLNGQQVPISYNNQSGIMEVNVIPGTNNLEMVFQRTWWRILSETISFLGWLVLIFILLKDNLVKFRE